MKIAFWSIGKQNESYVQPGIIEFTKRLSHYFSVEWKIIPPLKNASSFSEAEVKKKEGEMVFALLKPEDYLVALDEKGKQVNSQALATFIQQRANDSTKQLVFLIGGAFGIDEKVLQAAKFKWSLSPLTFPHQLVRLILTEAVYRACTILANEKYHHG